MNLGGMKGETATRGVGEISIFLRLSVSQRLRVVSLKEKRYERRYPKSRLNAHRLLMSEHGAHVVECRTNGSGEIIAMVGQDAIVVAIGD